MNKKRRIKFLQSVTQNQKIAQSIIDSSSKSDSNGEKMAEEILKQLWDSLTVEELESGL